MKIKVLIAAVAIAATAAFNASAKMQIRVNSEVTTHIVMPENIKMVDISTTKLIGNQCADNMVRIKPFTDSDSVPVHYREGELMGTVTLIGERTLAQYDVVYSYSPRCASSIYHVSYAETESYINPEVSMPRADMVRYAWAIYSCPQKTGRIKKSKHGVQAVVNNIYTVGDYFFIDYSLYNKTNIPYDIAELRVKLTDKKEVKATNSQTLELTPVYTLNSSKKFTKAFRNVLVLPKLTFPEEKQLQLEISENQISGRVVTISINYSDILSADGFGKDVLKRLSYNVNK